MIAFPWNMFLVLLNKGRTIHETEKYTEAEGTIQAHPIVIKRPEDQRGCWHQVFGNKRPVRIEIGMGKGRFILNMAKEHPDINFIGIERYSSVLLRAVENSIQKNSGN
mgnify:CR=1 FL=1